MNKFKAGDKVRNKATGAIKTVRAVPGMDEYDDRHFADASKGFTDEYSWNYQRNYELVSETPKREFKVGDRVKTLVDGEMDKTHKGETGVVGSISNFGKPIRVIFDDCHHDVEDKYDWFDSEDLELLEPTVKEVKEEKADIGALTFADIYKTTIKHIDETTTAPNYVTFDWGSFGGGIDIVKPKQPLMKKVSTLAKKLFDADTRALVESRFLNDDLTLSSTGKDALLDYLFLDYKKEMATEARRVIRAAKKDNEEEE
jgi:hypothetical protein